MKLYLKQVLLSSDLLLKIAAIVYSFPSYYFIKGRRTNSISIKGAFLKNTRIKLKGKNNTVTISPENLLKNCILNITGNNCTIEIGKRCSLANLELWIEDDGGVIIIGTRTTIEGGHIAATEGRSISIGEDCMFSHGIEIRNGDSHAIFDIESNERINPAKSVIMGNHVWLGADVKILKGSVIEDGCIIATGTIFTKQADRNSIYAGVPSRKVKEGIVWKRER